VVKPFSVLLEMLRVDALPNVRGEEFVVGAADLG